MKKFLFILLLLSFSFNAQTISLSQLISINNKFDINYSEKYLKEKGWEYLSRDDNKINYKNKYGDFALVSLYKGYSMVSFSAEKLKESYLRELNALAGASTGMNFEGDLIKMNYSGVLSDFIFAVKLLPKNEKVYSVTVFKLKSSHNTTSQTSIDNIAEDYYNSAIKLYEAGDLDGALGNIDKSLNTEPNNSNAHYVKGAIFHKKLNYKEALFNYKKAIQINSKNTDAMLKCGIIYGKMNDIVNACKYFSMACENGSDDGCSGYNSFCK